MTSSPVQVERRAAQRFGISLPISIRLADGQKEHHGFAQDLSARGIYFYCDFDLQEGAEVEITLLMPAEITLTDNMRVCCRGKVLRVHRPAANSAPVSPAMNAGAKIGVAVHFEHYEHLPDTQATSQSDQYLRVACLHRHHAEEESSDLPATMLRNH
jgi:PilZ domain